MRFKLDPLSPSGVSILQEQPKLIQKGGFAGSPDITRVLQPGTNVTFTGQGTQQSPYVVNATGGGAGTWGSITGTLSSQTDLQTALDAKLDLIGGTIGGNLTITPTANSANTFIINNQSAGSLFVVDSSATQVTSVNLVPKGNNTRGLGTTSLYWAGAYITTLNLNSTASINGNTAGQLKVTGTFMPVQAPTDSAPTYVEGGMYYDTTLHKMRIGGASGWETVTSV